MFVIVDSLTGMTLRFAKHLDFPYYQLGKDEIPFEKSQFFLLTRSFNFGEIPLSTVQLLRRHYKNCIGVAVSGNRNWGENYGAAGDKIEKIYQIPCILKFEGSGFKHDWELVNNYIKEREIE